MRCDLHVALRVTWARANELLISLLWCHRHSATPVAGRWFMRDVGGDLCITATSMVES